MSEGKGKIVLIGAGSAVFTRGLVADLILLRELGPWELALVDTDPTALETAEQLSRKMVESQGADVTISASTDRRDLLPGATVVVTTVGVGGRRAWETDVHIPRKYGVFQPVGDSVLPGGISRAMRVIPVLVEIARDVQELCPAAWFFNYANPMTANCWAIREATGVPVVGLCHGLFHVERQLAEFLGVPPEELTSMYVGLNHLTFVFDLRRNGDDLWPAVREKLAAERAASPNGHGKYLGKTFAEGFAAADNPFSWSLFEAYGAYPAVNDRHVVEFFPERFPRGDYYGLTLGVDAFSHAEIVAWGDERYAAMRRQALGEEPLDESIFRRSAGEHEQLLYILRSIQRDERKVFSVNMPNLGVVPNLPPDAVLEMPAAATATGLRPLQILDFPDTLAAVVTRRLTSVRLTVEAALTGDRQCFIEALLMDGAVTDRAVAEQMGEELLAAHKQYLPRFFSSV
jgi:alpha-galactosidase